MRGRDAGRAVGGDWWRAVADSAPEMALDGAADDEELLRQSRRWHTPVPDWHVQLVQESTRKDDPLACCFLPTRQRPLTS